MFSLKVVIARLLGTPTQPLDNPVPPTQTAGLVNQTPTISTGNKRSAQRTKPVAQKRKPKSSVAQSTTVAKSRKPKQKAAQPVVKASGANGSQRKTAASKTPQRVKQAPKRKP